MGMARLLLSLPAALIVVGYARNQSGSSTCCGTGAKGGYCCHDFGSDCNACGTYEYGITCTQATGQTYQFPCGGGGSSTCCGTGAKGGYCCHDFGSDCNACGTYE